jgi:hypothetical protein
MKGPQCSVLSPQEGPTVAARSNELPFWEIPINFHLQHSLQALLPEENGTAMLHEDTLKLWPVVLGHNMLFPLIE